MSGGPTSRVSATRPVSHTVRIAFGLFLMTLALRPQIIGIGPVASSIANELGISHAVVGLLTTVPILCMGLFAPLGPWVAGRVGPRRALTWTLVAIGCLGLVRPPIPAASLFVLVTIAIGVATGIGGALPQIAAKRYAPSRPGLAGGSASAGIVAGAVISAAGVVPLANAFGGWRAALAVLAVITIATTLGGTLLLGPEPRTSTTPARPRQMWRVPLAWLVAVVFGLQAIVYWGAGAWLAAAFIERGWDAASSGALVGVLNASALLASLGTAALSDRLGRRSLQILVSAIGVFAASVGLLVAPSSAVLWTAALGAGLGAIFPLLLVYCLDVAVDPATAGSLSAFMLFIGYTIAAVGPVGLGFARDLVGGFGVTFWILAAVSTMLVVTAIVLQLWAKPRTWLAAQQPQRAVR
jgi:MFS transporter, CP family, cyanate transporter